MLNRSLAVLTCAFLLVAAGSCSSGRVSVPNPQSAPVFDMAALPAPGSDLPSVHVNIPYEKGTSILRTVYGSDNGYHTDNAEVSGDSLILHSGETEFSAGLWLVYITYFDQEIPYVLPYDITIHTDGGGPYWVGLGDFKGHFWRVGETAYTGTENTVQVGLGSNAADVQGTFWFAVIGYGGDDVEVKSIDMNYPSAPGALGDPIDYHTLIEARDGTKLATDVFLPIKNTNGAIPPPPYPVILMRTPYDKQTILDTKIEDKKLPTYLAGLNVMLVMQYFRGRLEYDPETPAVWPNSEGIPSAFRDHAGPDHYDAIDTVDWIGGRQFYNGQLAATGPSALALWIYQAAPSLGTKLTSMYDIAAAGNAGNWAAIRNGCYKIGNVNGWLNYNGYPPDVAEEIQSNYLVDSYWNAVDFDKRAAQVRAPGYHETGWWDVDVESTIYSWQQLQHNGGAGAKGNQFLLIGPWSHDTFRENVVGDVTFPTSPPESDATNVPEEWDGAFWLLSTIGRNPFFTPPPDHVRYYMMAPEGETDEPNNHWYTAADWPPTPDSLKTLYVSDGDTGLVDAAPADGSMSYTVPQEGIATFGGANLPEANLGTGPKDQSEDYLSDALLKLRGDPLVEPVPIAGPVKVKLFFELTTETDAVDTNVIVKLIDEYPTGENMLVADSAVRLSWYLKHQQPPTEVVPGTVYELDFVVGQRAYVFDTGHKIGLDIQGSNVARFAENPGDGTPLGFHVYDQNCVVFVGGEQASQLILPEFDPSK